MNATTTDIERLFRRSYPSLLGLATALLHDPETARDIVHDVFAAILDNPPAAPLTTGYAARAVRNGCVNHLRHLSVRERFAGMFIPELEDAEEWPPETLLQRIRELVASYPSEQGRRVLRLRFGRGMKYAEIASELGISQVAVYKHLRHALDVLRQSLENDEK